MYRFYSSIYYRISYIIKVLLDIAAIEAAILDYACEHEDEGETCECPEGYEVAELGHSVLLEGGKSWVGNKGSQLLCIADNRESLIEDFIEKSVGNDEGWIGAIGLGLCEE